MFEIVSAAPGTRYEVQRLLPGQRVEATADQVLKVEIRWFRADACKSNTMIAADARDESRRERCQLAALYAGGLGLVRVDPRPRHHSAAGRHAGAHAGLRHRLAIIMLIISTSTSGAHGRAGAADHQRGPFQWVFKSYSSFSSRSTDTILTVNDLANTALQAFDDRYANDDARKRSVEEEQRRAYRPPATYVPVVTNAPSSCRILQCCHR